MANLSVTFSLKGACSYAWNKSTVEKASGISQLCSAMKAFFRAIYFRGYVVEKKEVESIYRQCADSLFKREYAEIKKKSFLNVKEAVKAKRCNESSKSILLEKTLQKLSPNEFINLMVEGSFSDDVHYSVTGDVVLPVSVTQRKEIKLPAYLSVDGNFTCTDNDGLKDLPRVFIVTKCIKLKKSTGLRDLSKSKLEAGKGIMFDECKNMEYAPDDIYGGGVSFTGCLSLNKFPKKFVADWLACINCGLKELPDGLILENLFVEGCEVMEKLPSQLKIGDMLRSDLQMPDDAEVGEWVCTAPSVPER